MAYIPSQHRTQLINKRYPVGSIYWSTTTTNPGTTLGVGTWARWGNGRAIIAENTTGPIAGTVGNTVGEKTHVLTVTELPAHTHGSSTHTHNNIGHNHYINPHTHSSVTHNHPSPLTTWHNWAGYVNSYGDQYPWGNSGKKTIYNVIDDLDSDNWWGYGQATSVGVDQGSIVFQSTAQTVTSSGYTLSNTGGNAAHNNLQPYECYVCWRRVS